MAYLISFIYHLYFNIINTKVLDFIYLLKENTLDLIIDMFIVMDKLAQYIKLVRPKHYIKNLFILAPVFFAAKFDEIDLILKAIFATVFFSFLAGAVYILNDYKDIGQDRVHPKKKFRPLAAGTVSFYEALTLFTILVLAGFTGMILVNIEAFLFAMGYFFLNIAYSLGLKNISLVDVCIVSAGFVIRLFVGSEATGVYLSNWIVILVFFLALFIAFAKRRDDFIVQEQTGSITRKVMKRYNENFLNVSIIITSAIILVAYTIYTTLDNTILKFGTDKLYFTSIFVILGILRYLQITFVEKNSGFPVEILLKDRFMQIILAGWILLFGLIIYL